MNQVIKVGDFVLVQKSLLHRINNFVHPQYQQGEWGSVEMVLPDSLFVHVGGYSRSYTKACNPRFWINTTDVIKCVTDFCEEWKNDLATSDETRAHYLARLEFEGCKTLWPLVLKHKGPFISLPDPKSIEEQLVFLFWRIGPGSVYRATGIPFAGFAPGDCNSIYSYTKPNVAAVVKALYSAAVKLGTPAKFTPKLLSESFSAGHPTSIGCIGRDRLEEINYYLRRQGFIATRYDADLPVKKQNAGFHIEPV